MLVTFDSVELILNIVPSHDIILVPFALQIYIWYTLKDEIYTFHVHVILITWPWCHITEPFNPVQFTYMYLCSLFSMRIHNVQYCSGLAQSRCRRQVYVDLGFEVLERS